MCLHVTGRRADGYHTLDSLVVFADGLADELRLVPASEDSLTIEGEFGAEFGAEAQSDNLVVAARDWLRRHAGAAEMPPVALTLVKHLPVAAGLGGGSADAAATLTLLMDHWRLPRQVLAGQAGKLATGLGADVPMCLNGGALRAQGIGERLEPLVRLPSLPAVLVNPGVGNSTRAVFAALTDRHNAPITDPPASGFGDPAAVADWLAGNTRNDLQAPALTLAPAISQVLEALTGEDARLARMSGSGTTCFGLFDTTDAARAAADALTRDTGWWVRAGMLNAGAKTDTMQKVHADA